jgi:hypothetical protein
MPFGYLVSRRGDTVYVGFIPHPHAIFMTKRVEISFARTLVQGLLARPIERVMLGIDWVLFISHEVTHKLHRKMP